MNAISLLHFLINNDTQALPTGKLEAPTSKVPENPRDCQKRAESGEGRIVCITELSILLFFSDGNNMDMLTIPFHLTALSRAK